MEHLLTQKEMIREHLEQGFLLDRILAFDMFGIFESPARISELRKEGMKIKTEHKTVTTRFGKKVQVAVWSKED